VELEELVTAAPVTVSDPGERPVAFAVVVTELRRLYCTPTEVRDEMTADGEAEALAPRSSEYRLVLVRAS